MIDLQNLNLTMEFRSNKKDTKYEWEMWWTELEEDHKGIRWKNDHHFWTDWVKPYIESIIREPERNIPWKWGLCKAPIISKYIEMNMSPEDLSTYQMYLTISELGPDKKIENCPFCKYYEIWHKESTSNFFYCKADGCKKGSCSICHKEFKLPKSESRITAEEEKQMFGEGGMFSHLKWYEYKDLKAEWDQAIVNGNQRLCPECGLGGMIDDKSTHIIWAGCYNRYWYVWGIAEKNLDKSDPNGGINRHNDDWQKNKKRCPQWLHHIQNIDSRWKGLDRTEWVLFFHKLLAYRNIKALIDKHGIEKLRELRKIFGSVAYQDYDLDEVENMDLTIVKIK